jgi:hypothetical protein
MKSSRKNTRSNKEIIDWKELENKESQKLQDLSMIIQVLETSWKIMTILTEQELKN